MKRSTFNKRDNRPFVCLMLVCCVRFFGKFDQILIHYLLQ